PTQCRLKIGLELFTAAGPAMVSNLVTRGFDVFLDLKYHDIPTTVARACAQAANLGAWMLNVHALGGMKMMQAAREAIEGVTHRPLLIGVTLLTSHGDDDITDIGLARGTALHVERLAGLAHTAGLDGVVCSPLEAAIVRRRFGRDFTLVTPGVRPAGTTADDQSRTRTPAEAVAEGADYLVIGRPITRAADPMAALEAINREIQVH
ncbi:MAG TPA: orotidine-5'-phosphate decarboxylase, partial [Candidatus Methylomirabilis sp.]|nr:orotidine-5'-phosphate decarboxylase [Candidatus Methylomirabilis sp.]